MDCTLFHVSWAIESTERRKECDAFFERVFAAQTGFEILVTPDNDNKRQAREESLQVIGDLMIFPIAPHGFGLRPESGIGRSLHFHAKPGMWVFIALTIDDVPGTYALLKERGFTPVGWDESRYIMLNRDEFLGITLELLKGGVPMDPRSEPEFDANWWRDCHPLGIEGLQCIGVSVDTLDQARNVFGRVDWPEISQRYLPQDDADCAMFSFGGGLIEAMQPRSSDSALALHRKEKQGIYCLTFKVRSAVAARDYLEGLGLTLLGDASRFAIDPAQAFDRLLYFTEEEVMNDSRRSVPGEETAA